LANYRKFIFLLVVVVLFPTPGCRTPNIGGVGWDENRDLEEAKRYPAIESNRILVTTEEVPYQTFKQEFDTVFQDFQYRGNLIAGSSETPKTQIAGTFYSVSYENFVLKVFRDGGVIAERNLPRVFYMHTMKSAAILGTSKAEDRILCRTQSRATSGLHYVFIADGNGDILFEKIMTAAEDWDILPSADGNIVIGGARSKTVISPRN
jgi:hypothetical protein